ncbi:hypothetical protein IFM89_035298 [Coptis chinensis]|uniref:Uncharacterized protein n=1 Tax=Coptis chinensis TaxID=261450 RepID=A0A835M5N1_9MAGN|nr:hypothetical protein IFM89_035298 [Coptis chinensis]
MEHPVVGNMEEKNIEEDGLGIENFVDAYMGHGIETGDIEPPFVLEPDLGKRYLDYKRKKQKNPNVKVRREDDWLTGHEHCDGSILESARVAYALKGSGCVTVSLYNASRKNVPIENIECGYLDEFQFQNSGPSYGVG